MKLGVSKKPYVGILGVSAIALMAVSTVAPLGAGGGMIAGVAYAGSHDSGDDHGDDHGGSGGKGGKGGKGGGDDHSHDDSTSDDHDHDDGDADDHDHTDGGSGKGPKAGGDHADGGSGAGQGGKGGSGEKGGSGNRPVWAGEGLPDVELGRLNVVRSPTHVLDRAYAESLSEFTTGMAEFYSLPLRDALDRLRTEFRDIEMIDSPLQNLALFREALGGTSVLITSGGVSNTNDSLMAMFLGTASDKSIPVTPETAYSVALILGYELSQASATALAENAEAVRQAVLEGHG